ncbi:hypothetical protein [Desulfotalea psychrophila]|uniref:hypothetical protein n=1 Tax=Desulfotalea psychrophila TaxID=84980 RepID=UPI0002FD2F4D|nr:hypothetical protein [Desulfotalea psychrophila]
MAEQGKTGKKQDKGGAGSGKSMPFTDHSTPQSIDYSRKDRIVDTAPPPPRKPPGKK